MTAVVPPVALPSHYELIAHFNGNLVPGSAWRSSVVIKQTTLVPQPADNIIVFLANFFKDNLRTDCNLDHLELRNWARGVQPFSQSPAIWLDSSHAGPGNKTNAAAYGAQGANGVGIEVACFIRVSTTGPKEGKMFLRQLLDSGDIAAIPGGKWQFLIPGPPNVTDAKFQAVLFNTNVNTLFASDPGLRVVHFPLKRYLAHPTDPQNQPFSTTINNMHLVGATVNKATRKSRR